MDGKLTHESDVIKLDSETQQLNVSVKDASELKLVVETNGGNTDDDAAWGNARLVK